MCGGDEMRLFKEKVYVNWDEFISVDSDAEFWGFINKLARLKLGEVIS